MSVQQSSGGKSFSVSFNGMDKMRERMKALGPAGSAALAKGVREEAEALMEHIKDNEVPRDLGGLVGSGYVTDLIVLVGGYFSIRFGFGGTAAPYAWAIHENPRAGKTGGVSPKGHRYKHYAKVGGWKFLERPMDEWTKSLSARLAKRVGDAWHKVVKK